MQHRQRQQDFEEIFAPLVAIYLINEEFILINKLNVPATNTTNDKHIHCATWKYAENAQKRHICLLH